MIFIKKVFINKKNGQMSITLPKRKFKGIPKVVKIKLETKEWTK